MDVTLVQDPQDDIDRNHGRENQDWLVRKRGQKGLSGALVGRLHAGGNRGPVCGIDGIHRFPERHAGGEVEGKGHHGKLPLMIDGQRGGAGLKTGEGAERNLLALAERT